MSRKLEAFEPRVCPPGVPFAKWDRLVDAFHNAHAEFMAMHGESAKSGKLENEIIFFAQGNPDVRAAIADFTDYEWEGFLLTRTNRETRQHGFGFEVDPNVTYDELKEQAARLDEYVCQCNIFRAHRADLIRRLEPLVEDLGMSIDEIKAWLEKMESEDRSRWSLDEAKAWLEKRRTDPSD